MPKQIEVTPVFVEFAPNVLEHNTIYISKEYKCAVHLCLCGCGHKSVTPLGEGEWTLTENDGKVSLQPSIGNWSHEAPNYHAHYVITNNIATFDK